MLQHATEAPDVRHGVARKLALVLSRIRELPQAPPPATGRMRDKRRASGPSPGVALLVPYIDRHGLVDRIRAGEQDGDQSRPYVAVATTVEPMARGALIPLPRIASASA